MPEVELTPWQQKLLPQNASVFDPSWMKTARAIAHLLGVDDPVAAVMGTVLPAPAPGEGGAAEYLAERFPKFAETLGIKAYHGSPHDFEQFSTAKIGTGEGAQAYGHGLYFAENPAVSAEYARMNLSGPANIAHKLKDQTPEYVAHRLRSIYPSITDQEVASAIADAGAKGKTYEVAINAHPDQFLDWDKPINQQSEAVQKATAQIRGDYGMGGSAESTGREFHRALENDIAANAIGGVGGHPSADAAWMLNKYGVSGIKYADAGSRWTPRNPVSLNGGQTWIVDLPGPRSGEFTSLKEAQAAIETAKTNHLPTSNYVVFDDKKVDILRKYGLLLPAAGAAGAAQRQGE